MAGIYIHIPFCRQKCYYCDFYKTINTSQTENFLKALQNEAELRKDYINGESISTIYFGGGTPSVLKEKEIAFILNFLNRIFQIETDAEITFEANPDDLTPVYLQALGRAGINRLSIGVQAFQDEHLKKMNRRHNAQQALHSIENASVAGFTNLSADLIYGLPGLTRQQWKQSLTKMFRLPVDHLSAYHLTYHEGTPFFTWLKKGTLSELPENESLVQFHLLLDEAAKAGFEQYEISNFARKEMYSRHNTAYWTDENYLGLGPSAHSFNGNSRRWNVSRLETYIGGVTNNLLFWEEEQLSDTEKFNEYIITRMRTKWGISVQEISNRFGEKRAKEVVKHATGYLQSGKMKETSGTLTLTREGLFVSDDLMAGFMII
ncbi:MAG TPA: radical SAM family heme chaperone HemW [Mariniphaga anaerophila]|uniref:Heme chaperone HemW n=1 Tax=Mariniphaga anaerophila TaxID=1484053 RepID=A0A831LPF0_9BACT|nr:radical SAM family heme chaperone HemW [Mariniphaga anaerophila]